MYAEWQVQRFMAMYGVNNCADYVFNARIINEGIHHHLHIPPWIRSFDLFKHRRIAIFSWGVHDLFFLEGVFRESGVVHSFKVVDPVSFVFESPVLWGFIYIYIYIYIYILFCLCFFLKFMICLFNFESV